MTSSRTKNRLTRTRGADHVDEPPKLTPVAKRRRGRPEIELEPEMIAVAVYMAKNGATQNEIADELGVSRSLIYNWYAEHPQFLDAVKSGRTAFSQRVIGALGQRAVGYTYESEKVFSNGFRATVHEHVPADVGAAINWLVNANVGWRRGDNVVQDALDVAAQAANPDAPVDTRQLALAAIGLLGAAALGVGSPASPMVDVTPNPAPAGATVSYDTEDDDFQDEEPAYDDRDPDFDI